MSEQVNLKANSKFYAWLRSARIQFYPMTFIAYSLGAVCGFTVFRRFDVSIFLAGYFAIFLIELCTILANEYYDYNTDRINKNSSVFTGGSRVLVEGGLALAILIVIPHVLMLLSGLVKLIRSDNFNRRIDHIMTMALSYIVWFGLIPLLSLSLAK